MIKDKQPRKSKIEINLSGPDGNAFVLMGIASNLHKKLNMGKDTILKEGVSIDTIIDEMKSGDYENLIQTFDKYFGDYVILYRK